MHDAQRRVDAEYAETMREYEAECAERDKAVRAKVQEIPPQPDEPVRRQWLVGDTTPEALAHVLKGNPRGVVSLHDELGSLFGGFGRYTKNANAEPGAAFYKSAFNGTPFTENRKGDKGRGRYTRIEAPLVSIAGALQPDAFQRLVTRQYVEDGLASRFLWVWPPDRPGGWVDDHAEDTALVERYVATYQRLCAIPLDVAPDGALQSASVGLGRPAQGLARTWVNALRNRVAAAPDPAVRAALVKLKGIAFRLALLFHLTNWAAQGGNGDFGAIGEQTLSRAILVTDWFAHEAARVYGLLAESDVDRDRRRLVELIQGKGGSVTPRDLMRSSRQYPTAVVAECALDDLVGAGYGRLESVQAGPRGGRPTIRFRLSDAAEVDRTPSDEVVSAGNVNVNTVNGTATGVAAAPFKSEARDVAARLIRNVRRGGDDGFAVAMREAWRERMAICTIDGELAEDHAERVALDELKSILAQRQG